MSRRKNPHPKRAVNARTVLKVAREEPLVLCSKIPDEDDDFEGNHHQIQKEEEEDDDVEQLRRIMCVPRGRCRDGAKSDAKRRGNCFYC